MAIDLTLKEALKIEDEKRWYDAVSLLRHHWYKPSVRFCDLPISIDTTDKRFLPLKVVAANVHMQRPQVFSRYDTPNIFVGDAVAASMALPVIFRPAHVRGLKDRSEVPVDITIENGEERNISDVDVADKFCDGGLVSNFPGWSFDEERTADRELFTIGVKLPTKDEGDRYPARLVKTAVFGSGTLEERFLRGGARVEADVDFVKLLDFNMSVSAAEEAIKEGKAAFVRSMTARARIRKLQFHTCRRIAANVQTVVNGGTFRVAWLVPNRKLSPTHLKTVHSFRSDNMYWDDDLDRLTFPMDISFFGKVWQRDKSRYIQFQNSYGVNQMDDLVRGGEGISNRKPLNHGGHSHFDAGRRQKAAYSYGFGYQVSDDGSQRGEHGAPISWAVAVPWTLKGSGNSFHTRSIFVVEGIDPIPDQKLKQCIVSAKNALKGQLKDDAVGKLWET